MKTDERIYCQACGNNIATVLVGIQLQEFELGKDRTRIRQVNIYLCEDCRKLEVNMFRRDSEQQERVAKAITQRPRISMRASAYARRQADKSLSKNGG